MVQYGYWTVWIFTLLWINLYNNFSLTQEIKWRLQQPQKYTKQSNSFYSNDYNNKKYNKNNDAFRSTRNSFKRQRDSKQLKTSTKNNNYNKRTNDESDLNQLLQFQSLQLTPPHFPPPQVHHTTREDHQLYPNFVLPPSPSIHQQNNRENHFQTNSCSESNGFSADQERFCHLYPDHVLPIFKSANLAVAECFNQFSGGRWNCSVSPWGNHSSLLVLPDYLPAGCKEASITKAFFSASISYTISRACRDGQLALCGCSRRRKPTNLASDWVWGGCGDNTEYGFKFGVGFVDSREREMNHPRHSTDLKIMLSNLHNNMVGRRVVVALSKPSCKCHGASGSCSIKTCWHQLPEFKLVGRELKLKYDESAQFVKFNSAGTSLIVAKTKEENKKRMSKHAQQNFKRHKQKHTERNVNRVRKKIDRHQKIDNSKRKNLNAKKLVLRHKPLISDQQNRNYKDKNNFLKPKSSYNTPSNTGFKKRRQHENQFDGYDDSHKKQQIAVSLNRPSKDNLIYTEPSPDFCESITNSSWSGTHGRPCKRGDSGRDGCDLLCCGRGYNTFREKIVERCRCQFVWCCSVHCSTCEKYVDVHVCK